MLSPPDPKQQVIEELVAEGFLDPVELRKPGLAGWRTPGEPQSPPLSEALRQLRDEDDR